jgi:hypothetical protein
MATPDTVTIACKLPNGLFLEGIPSNPKLRLMLRGANQEKIIGSGYGTTEIPTEFWKEWSRLYKDYTPYKTGAIFAVGAEKDAELAAKTYEKVKTGLEPLDPRAHGVKPASED